MSRPAAGDRVPSRPAVAVTPGPFTWRPTGGGHEMTLGRAVGDDEVLLGRVVPVEAAEVAVFPFELSSVVRTRSDLDALRRLVAENAAAGLRTVLCLDHDFTRPIDLGQPAALVLRTSMTASSEYAGDVAMPAAVEDPWAGRTPTSRPWMPRPGIGFMGKVDAALTHRVAGYLPGDPLPEGTWLAGERVPSAFPQPVDISGVLRRRALAGLSASSHVDASIVVRETFHGLVPEQDRLRMRAEYGAHLAGSDYVLCVRGAGNYSIRLFETVAMGRVPVLLETDLVLPCADVVDWDAFCVRVPLVDIDRVDEHVVAAHAQGPEVFARRQVLAREAWTRCLSAESFARYVSDVILVARGGV